MTNLPATAPVSCIIAVYNGERYLVEAIDSVLTQDYPYIEVVVVNDGSTDGTAGVLASYADRLRVVTQPNRGVSAARNLGVEAATGDLLCFLDADDKLRPEKVSRQVAVLEADRTLDLCDCHMDQFWSPELTEGQLAQDPRYHEPHWRKRLPGATPTWLFRRTLWDLVGGFQTYMSIGEDTDWITRARDLPMRRHTLPEALVDRRLHPMNTTAIDHSQREDALTSTIKAHLERLRKKTPL